LREDPYFLEKVPKMYNLFALLKVTSEIILQIIGQIKPKDYDNQMKSIKPILLILNKNIFEDGKKVYMSNQDKRAINQVCVWKIDVN